jgi:uncharacterized membrane protein YciS (DUF1049 family)
MLRIIKWTLFFLFSFVVSWILIITFSQEAFKAAVPVRAFMYTTKAFPIYHYIIASFVIGLILGLLVAAYYFIMLNTRLAKKGKQIKNLEQTLQELKPEHATATEAVAAAGPVSLTPPPAAVTNHAGEATGDGKA